MTATATETYTPIVQDVLREFYAMGRAVERVVQAQTGMHLATILLLEEIRRFPAITPTQLAKHLGVGPQTLTSSLASLLRAGFVQREVLKGHHCYMLTDSGAAELERVRERWADVGAQVAAEVRAQRLVFYEPMRPARLLALVQ